MKKKIFICITLFLSINACAQPKDTLYFVSGIPFVFDERIEEVIQRPVLFSYNYDSMGLDTIFQLSPQKPFINIDFIGLYNTFGSLIILGNFYTGKYMGDGEYCAILKIVDLNTVRQDSVIIKEGVTSESNLFVLNPDSIYYCVRPMNTRREKGFNKIMQSKNFEPKDYNYAYIQGQVGTPIHGREYLVLYNEKTNDNALHISKGGGYGLKVGPYLELQPPKEMYNAYPPTLKSIIVNDSHSMIISYDRSREDGNSIGKYYCIIYDKISKEWYRQTFRGNTPSVRSYDNGWVTGTIKDMDKGWYYDKSTATRSRETYDFKREIPGYEERVPIFYERTDGVWGDCFDERAKYDGIYYPGLLYLFNVHTKDYIEWDTRQGDSEVLLVQDDMVYYRVNTKILKSAIVNNQKLGEPELLIDDVRVRDIHWAYLKKGK
jgi:hypothetical protein